MTIQPNENADFAGLDIFHCRNRQRRLCDVLKRMRLQAALLTNRRHVHYLTGYWCREIYRPLALLMADGMCILVVPMPVEGDISADSTQVYSSFTMGTLVDHQLAAACEPLRATIASLNAVGCDGAVPLPLLNETRWFDITLELLRLRRSKDPDEIGLLRRAIAATEAAYAVARERLAPGIRETDLFAAMQGAAVAQAGESIGEFGNDFQIGSLGSAPRRLPAREGDVAILDVSVVLRGYASDMCRSFVVGGKPTAAQKEAHRAILEALAYVETAACAGMPCRELDRSVRIALSPFPSAEFPHHLGHGIGIDNHEAPRINADSDDVIQPGDVFTAEPGLYGPELCAGIRIEQIYWMDGPRPTRLTHWPTDL